MGKPVVLVVEDDPEVRALICKYLEKLNLEVHQAATGQRALTVLETLRPDLICLDLMLPEISGYQVCEAIRKNPAHRKVPILVISARSTPVDRAYAEEAGADAYLIKPFTRAEFASKVEALIGPPRPTA